jgi:PDDEXK-like domain of unknown function (DUF3799)
MKPPKLSPISWDGKAIAKPGLYDNIPIDTYHAGNICAGLSVSSSHLRRLSSKSPAHFWYRWPGNPAFEPEPERQHLVLGRAAHHLFLGEGLFSKSFVAERREYPDAKTGEMKPWTYQAAYCKQWRAQQQADNLSILKPDDVDDLRGMAEALHRNDIIKLGALNGLIEKSVFWLDKDTGLWLKARPDAIPVSSVDFVDLKITKSVLWPDLQRTIYEYGYHQQGALICRGAREVLKIENPTFTLVFVEHKKPYCVRVVEIKDNDLARGEKQNRAALDLIAQCLKTKQWPGPGASRAVEYIELPGWAQNQIDDKLTFGE